MTEARREDYWERIEEADTLKRRLTEKCHADGWTPHALIAAGETDDGTLFVSVIRSKVREQGLILSERYAVIDPDRENIKWSSEGVERRVNGPIAQALARAYARASNDPYAANPEHDDLSDPLTLGVRSGAVEDDPDTLTAPISPDKSHHAVSDDDGELTCEECGYPINDKSEAINMGDGLGQDYWIHKSCPNDGDR